MRMHDVRLHSAYVAAHRLQMMDARSSPHFEADGFDSGFAQTRLRRDLAAPRKVGHPQPYARGGCGSGKLAEQHLGATER